MGVAPLTAGLMLSSGYLLTRASDNTPVAYLLTAVTVALIMATRINPLWLIGAGALIGLGGFV